MPRKFQALFLAVLLGSCGKTHAKPLWTVGTVIEYDIPTPLRGRMVNGRVFQYPVLLNQGGSSASYIIRVNRDMYHCAESSLRPIKASIRQLGIVQVQIDEHHLKFKDEAGKIHKTVIYRYQRT